MAQRAICREQKLHRVIARHGFCAEAISNSQSGDCLALLAMTDKFLSSVFCEAIPTFVLGKEIASSQKALLAMTRLGDLFIYRSLAGLVVLGGSAFIERR